MDEARYRHDQMVRRLFGPSVRLDGSIGSQKAPGELRIVLDGRTIASGESFATALQAASERLSGLSVVVI